MPLTIPMPESYSRYDTDERLTVDPPKSFKCPLQLDSVQLDRRKDTTLSSPALLTVTPRVDNHRSIFSDYWKTDSSSRSDPSYSRLSSSLSQTRIPMEDEKQQSPTRRRRIIHKTFTYNYDGNANPFQYFGIEEDETSRLTSTDSSTDASDDDSDSLNSYERILQRNETRVNGEKKNRNRSATCPSLSHSMAGLHLDRTQKKAQSDTVLYIETPKRPSCLRKSRFSFSTDGHDCNTTMILNSKGERKGERRPSVSFQPMIKVHEFQEPVEKWAPPGWSNWFGAWK